MATTTTNSGFASPLEASSFLGLGREMIYKLCGEGKLGDVRVVGKTYLIPWSDVKKYAATYVSRRLQNGYGKRHTIKCAGCKRSFTVTHGYRNRKYCSFECSVRFRTRPNWNKKSLRVCPQCRESFEVIGYHKARFCSHKCATDANRGKPNWRAKADTKRIVKHGPSKCTTEDGRKMLTHRYAVEKNIKRLLRSREVVHHVDLDNTNNSLTNLCLMRDETEHQLAHRSIDGLIKSLMEMGIIGFNGKRYVLTA